jgi:hypothetical protein
LVGVTEERLNKGRKKGGEREKEEKERRNIKKG